MKRILVGIDGSKQSWSAVSRAAELAKQTGAALRVVHVLSSISPLAAEEYAKDGAPWLDSPPAYARGLLQQAVERVQCDDVGVQVDTLVAEGPAAETLARLGSADEVTMTVIGHRERSRAARLLAPGVAHRLVQLSSRPVLVVH